MLPGISHTDNGFQVLKTVKKTPPQHEEQMTQNGTAEPHNSIEQNTTEYSLDTNDAKVFDSSEAIADLAEYLDACEDAEDLMELQQGSNEITRQRMNRACRLLSLEKQRVLRKWAIKNQQQKLIV